MLATLRWTLGRGFRNRRTWIVLLTLTLASILVSGGVTRTWSKEFDVGLLGVSYGVSFATMEEFLAWYKPFQLRWLISAGGAAALLPVLTCLFPDFDSPDTTVPVLLGRTRTEVFVSELIFYGVMALLLWLSCFVLGLFLSGMPLTSALPASYYVRAIGLALWLFLGFAGLSLALTLLPKNRFMGMAVSFSVMLCLTVSRNSGFFRGTFLKNVLYDSSGRTDLWMWAEEMNVSAGEALPVVLFPAAAILLACVIGLSRLRRRDLGRNGGEFL